MVRRIFRQLLVGAVAAGAVLGLCAAPASAAVGQRIASGDGDTVNKCLDWRGAGSEPLVQMWACNDGEQQNWRYVRTTSGGNSYWEIKSRKRGYENWCVSVPYFPLAQVAMEPCGRHTGQRWIKHDHTATWHSWENWFFLGRCLDVKDYGTSDVVWLFECRMNQGNQRWKMY